MMLWRTVGIAASWMAIPRIHGADLKYTAILTSRVSVAAETHRVLSRRRHVDGLLTIFLTIFGSCRRFTGSVDVVDVPEVLRSFNFDVPAKYRNF